MVMEDGKTPQLPELMCHVNLDIDPRLHRALFGITRYMGSRVVTLSQGMLDARVPDGFGFPLSSTEPLNLVTQVLNHNIESVPRMYKVVRPQAKYHRSLKLLQIGTLELSR